MKKFLPFTWLRAGLLALWAVCAATSSTRAAADDACCVSLPSSNDADGLVRLTYGNSPFNTGVAPYFSRFVVDIQPGGGSVPTPAIPAGSYSGWCVDVTVDVPTGPFLPGTGNTAGVLYGGRLMSTCDPASPLFTEANSLPNHPGLQSISPTVWRQINYLINHRLAVNACAGRVPTMWEVQNAITTLLGQTVPLSPPYPVYTPSVVTCLVNEAVANAPTWQSKCGDKVAVVYNIEYNWDDLIPDVQVIILEVPCTCLDVSVTSDTECVGGTGTLTATVNGSPVTPLTYVWTGPVGTGPFPNSATINVSVVGDYTVKVTDSAGGSGSATGSFSVFGSPTLGLTASQVTCNGTSSGSVEATFSEGTGPYTISFNGGDFEPAVSPKVFGSLAAGQYSVTIKDANGCVAVANITITEPLKLTASSTYTPILCFGGGSMVTVTAEGGTAPYTGTGTFNVVAGSHQYTVKDANGCESITSVTISQPTAIEVNLTKVDATCAVDTGSVTATFSGGSGSYLISIDGSAFVAATSPTVFSAVSISSHSVVVKDANECTVSKTIVVGRDCAPPTLSCVGGTFNVGQAVSLSFVASGGKAPYAYSIDSGALPPELTLNPVTGEITGTASTPGTFTFVVKVVDALNNVALANGAECSITINSGPCLEDIFTFSGNSSGSGTAGNVRLYTAPNGVQVKASAFSREKSTGVWAPAFLGVFSGGLGVTDGSEDGAGNSHTDDNAGTRDNYILFEFSSPVTVDRAYLGYVAGDSDLTAWIGNFVDPFNNHLTLSDAVLSSFGSPEASEGAGSARWADLNSGAVTGNAFVVAARPGQSDDYFKIQHIDFCQPGGQAALAKIGNRVWNDLNKNGVQDTGENGVDGVTVKLFRCSDNTEVASTTTANGGMYEFSVAPGDYYVIFSNLPAGYVFSPSTAGGASDPTDSDANPSNGRTDCTTLSANENDDSWDAGIYLPTPPPDCVATSLTLSGGFSNCETYGNIRTFAAANGVTVKVSAFSRNKSTGAWAPAYLGSYGGGLGVIDTSEDGYGDSHTVDNIGRNNYVLFEFSQPVAITKACLGYVSGDSDLSLWVGTFSDPFNNHLNLNDSVLGGFGYSEVNTTTSGYARCADLNAGAVVGNAIIIAAYTDDTSPEDRFKIQQLDLCVPGGVQPVETATIGNRVWKDSNKNGVQDDGEVGVNGVTVKLYRCSDNSLVDTTSTANGGLYSFTVAPGSYYVGFSGLPAGYVLTSSTASTASDPSDSDAAASTGKTGCTTLSANENDASWDAGLVLSSTCKPGSLVAYPGNCKVTLSWTSCEGATGYKIKRCLTSGGSYTTVKTCGTTPTCEDLSLENGKCYYYKVCAVYGTDDTTDSNECSAIPTGGLPSPWASKDIGAVGATGSASYSSTSGVLTLNGSGEDIWNCVDEFRYAYQPAVGNCSVVARVSGVEATHVWSKAGVMIRETLAANSEHASVFVTPSNGVAFQSRDTTGGLSENVNHTGVTAPYWVKIVRNNNYFTAYRSSNGSTWTQVGSSIYIPMASSCYIGLAVTSHADGDVCTATFDSITAIP